MNKGTLFALGGLITILGSAFVFFNQGYCHDQQRCDEQISLMGGATGLILPYDENAVQEAFSRGDRVGLYFEANWCANCKLIKDELIEKGIPSWATLFTLDFDQRSDLRKQYEIMNVHTLIIIDQDGNLIAKDDSGEYDRLYTLLD